jgi:hypothetical protein
MQYPLSLIGQDTSDTSAYLRDVFLSHVLNGSGGAYFDFSGDTTILDHLPVGTIFFNPTDTQFPIGLNPLHNPTDTRATLDAIVSAWRSVWPSDIATTRIDLYQKAALLSVMATPDANLLGLGELYLNDEYREYVIGHVHDPVLLSFWDRYESLPVKDRLSFTESTVTRALTFSIDPVVQNIIGQKKTTFSLTDTSVIVASFSPELGVEAGNFLATLLLYTLPDNFLVVLDGGHRVGTTAVRHALSRLRVAFSYRYGAELRGGLHETLIGTAKTIVAFRCGQSDSKRLSPEFQIVQEADMLHHLTTGTYRLRHEGGVERREITFNRTAWPREDPRRLIGESRYFYGRPRDQVEASIDSFFHIDRVKKKRRNTPSKRKEK